MSGHRNPVQSVFITGAAAGIGRATALRFAAAGWFVGLYDINGEAVRALAAEIGPQRARAGTLDVADFEAFGAALAEFASAAGRLDVLVNNAGVLVTGDFEAQDPERYRRMIDINCRGVSNGCLAAFPHLKPGARVINLASASAIYGSPAFAVYGATKFFVRGLTEALDIEWRRHGVRVIDLLPLFVATPMVEAVADKPASVARLGVRLSAEDVAHRILLAATRPSWRCGIHWHVGAQTLGMALLARLLPARVYSQSVKLISGY